MQIWPALLFCLVLLQSVPSIPGETQATALERLQSVRRRLGANITLLATFGSVLLPTCARQLIKKMRCKSPLPIQSNTLLTALADQEEYAALPAWLPPHVAA